MDEFCGSNLWQYNLTWNITSQPDLTPCFQETILTWIPCLILWLLAPLDIYNIYQSRRRYIPVTLLNLFKMFLSIVLCVLSVAELIESFTHEDAAAVSYVTPAIRASTYLLAFAMHVLHRNRGVHTSGSMLLFWFAMAIAVLINFRSLLRSNLIDHATETLADWHISEFKLTLRIVSAPLVLVQLVLACIADKKAHDPFVIANEDFTHQSPENEASVLSYLTFKWLDSFMLMGYKQTLTQEDLYSLKYDDKTEVVSHKFNELLQPAVNDALNERRNKSSLCVFDPAGKALIGDRDLSSSYSSGTKRRPTSSRDVGKSSVIQPNDEEDESASHVNMTSIIFRTFWLRLFIASICKLISSLLTFASPILLSAVITFVSTESEPGWRGILYAVTLFALSVADSIFNNREQFLTNITVMRIRTCMISAIYHKTLRLSNQGRKCFTTGQIVNLMAVDAQRVADVVQNINSIWSAPMQIIISMVLLYQQLGVATFAGLGIMLFNVPINIWISTKIRSFQIFVMKHKDRRIKLLSEIINGIKIIKIHSWEESFRRRTEKIRGQEIDSLTAQTWYSAGIVFTFTCLPIVVALVSFVTYVLLDSNNILDANKIFVSLSLFNIIRIPLAILPMLITNLSMYFVSVKRINKFLESEETDPAAIQPIDDEHNVIKIKDGKFRWERDGEIVLNNINLEISRRKLVAIVGPVGSGKSSLLSAILGDTEKVGGKVMLDEGSSVAYVPQEAWILNSPVRDNIMLNKVVNEDRYQRVIDSCALKPDLDTLELGDLSEIGEKGINLSGGQKQRISLARAVYADTDIYLFDDPLSAVDVHVGRHIFDKIIGPKGLLRDRTRVLVTNKLSVLPECDHIIVLKDGCVTEFGTYEELLKDRGLFSQLLVKHVLDNSTTAKNISDSARDDLITQELQRLETNQHKDLKNLEHHRPSTDAQVKQTEDSSDKGGTSTGRQQIDKEVTQVGSVKLSVHMNFIRTMGVNFMIALVIYVSSAAFALGSNFWLTEWSEDARKNSSRNDTSLRNLRIGVYAGLGLGESICVIVSSVLLNIACLKSSNTLHNKMLARILKAPMSWFNVTPSGRIINRFSKDIDTVDLSLRFNVRMLMVIAIRSVTSLILISVGSSYTIILIVPIVLLYFLFQMFYISTSRQLKRIESTTKSPIYSHFTETINGTSSIKAFKLTNEFELESNHRVDVNNSSYYMSVVASRWLAMRLEFLGFIVVLTASLIAVISRGIITPGVAGLTVTYSLSVTSVLSFLVRTYSDYETNVVSVERLLEYTRTPVEPENEDEPEDPAWPARGDIKFEKFSTSYRPDLGLVLRGIDLSVRPAERVGLIGRTGSGKSSLTLALFRILEPTGGRIVIDGVDISQIGLKSLRSKLSIIPQEPIMFTGTIRQNVDPTGSHPDHEIWCAVELAHLSTFLRSLPSGLDHQVTEGGNNFSVGQKQLFCLARTLLRRSKILILDEATAAVDVETDNLIQQTIRSEFNEATILTVAHRLETIQDYDRIVVLQDGQIVEEGKPDKLLGDKKSKYHALVSETKSN